MNQLHKWYFSAQMSLLFLIMSAAYLHWPVAIIITSCTALIVISITGYITKNSDTFENSVQGNYTHINKKQKNAVKESNKESNNEMEKSLSDMFFTLEKTFNNERSIINNEINRTKKLLNEAVIGMNESFYKIKKINDRQSSILFNLVQGTSDSVEENLNNLSEMSNEMDNAVYHIVMSLQFEDITSQALDSISANIDQFDIISQKINSASYSDESMLSKFNKIKDICELVNEKTNNINQQRTVSQMSMKEGEIELF